MRGCGSSDFQASSHVARHKVGTKVTQSYNHHEYKGEKAALLQRWADYLTTPVTPLQLFKHDA